VFSGSEDELRMHGAFSFHFSGRSAGLARRVTRGLVDPSGSEGLGDWGGIEFQVSSDRRRTTASGSKQDEPLSRLRG
jgi:hypothetical protein